MQKIILATTSKTRIAAFELLNLDFITIGSNVYEYSKDRPTYPDKLVQYLSKLKAEAVDVQSEEGIIMGFDSVGYFNGEILEKPKSREEAFQRLLSLSEKSFIFYTGIHIINTYISKTSSQVIQTKVKMREILEKEINKYLDDDPDYKLFALGFNPWRSYASTFIKEISGSYNNVLRGIPLEVVMEMLFDIGYTL